MQAEMTDRAKRGPCADPTLYRSEFEHDACGIGALAHLKGVRSHQIIDDALSVLVNLEHRGGVGLEPNTGDGAGILIQVPHRFFRKEAQKCGSILPDEGEYGVAMLFLPTDEEGMTAGMRIFEDGCAAEGIPLLFWRDVPVDCHDLGTTALECMPVIKQAFVGRPSHVNPGEDFERALYVCRRTIEKQAQVTPALAGQGVLRMVDERTDDRLQGHARLHADARLLLRSRRRDDRLRDRARALALLDEYDAVVGTRPSSALHRP